MFSAFGQMPPGFPAGMPPIPQQHFQQPLPQPMHQQQGLRADRKLYVGNLPPNLTPDLLTEYLNQALKKMGINLSPPGNSVVTSWIARDGHFAFVEFRTPDEADRAFDLNKVEIMGHRLKVGRPKSDSFSKASQPITIPTARMPGYEGIESHMLN